VELEIFLTYIRLKKGFRFILRSQIVEFEFLCYENSLGEPNILLGELGFPTLSHL